MRRMYSKPQLLEAVEQESKINGIKVFEDVLDNDGHKRFIEGAITLHTISGFTQNYGRWSLSGTHLMIVLAFTVASGTSFGNGVNLCSVAIPKWVLDKVAVLWGTSGVALGTFNGIGSDTSSQSISGIVLGKEVDSLSIVRYGTATTMTADRNFRIEYDLLIDNE